MHSSSKAQLTALLILTLLSATAAIALVVFIASANNTGFIGEGSIIVSSCPSSYLTSKYSNMGLINSLIFTASCLAALVAIHIAFTVIFWYCKSSEHRKDIPQTQLYFFSSCEVLASLPIFGYLLSFQIQLPKCSAKTSYSIIITLIAGALLLLALIKNILIGHTKEAKQDVEKKYRFIESQQTEHGEERKPIKHNRKQPKQASVHQEHTKQAINIFTEPQQQKSPNKNISRFQTKINPTKFDEEHNYSIKHQSPSLRREKPPIYLQERITINLHPNFRQIDPSQYVQNEKRGSYQVDIIHNQFQQEQQKYLQNMHNNILPSGGLEERERPGKNHNNYEDTSEKRVPLGFNNSKGGYKSNMNHYQEHYPQERQKYYSPNKRINRHGENKQNYHGHLRGGRNQYFDDQIMEERSFQLYDSLPRRNNPNY